MKAIENGICTSSTKERLEELERQKEEINQKIEIEKNKELFSITRADIIKYLKKAITKEPVLMIRLLIK